MSAGAGISPFTQIGSISKSHGLKGELKVSFESDETEALSVIKMIYLQNARGDFYPCRINHFRVEGKGNQKSFFVQFENISDRNSADSLKGKPVFIETSKTGVLNLWIEETELTYDDFEIINEENEHVGLVIDELDNGAHLILTVATTNGSLLIPVVEQFVISIDEEKEVIICRNLDLLEAE